MKTLRQVRDRLHADLVVALEGETCLETQLEVAKKLCYEASVYILMCNDEEFEALSKDIPEDWNK
jgi:hypothetical protein